MALTAMKSRGMPQSALVCSSESTRYSDSTEISTEIPTCETAVMTSLESGVREDVDDV